MNVSFGYFVLHEVPFNFSFFYYVYPPIFLKYSSLMPNYMLLSWLGLEFCDPPPFPVCWYLWEDTSNLYARPCNVMGTAVLHLPSTISINYCMILRWLVGNVVDPLWKVWYLHVRFVSPEEDFSIVRCNWEVQYGKEEWRLVWRFNGQLLPEVRLSLKAQCLSLIDLYFTKPIDYW